MRTIARTVGIGFVIALLASATAALAAGGSGHVFVSTCKHEKYKPKNFTIFCGDGNEYLASATWSSWTKSDAKGKGTVKANDCTPSCASGHFHSYAAKVKLTKPISCSGQKHKVFSRIKLTYVKKHPGPSKVERDNLFCPT